MRIRDIQQTGYYGRRTAERDDADPNGQAELDLAIQAVHVIGILPMFVLPLARHCAVPLIEDANRDAGIMPPSVLFGQENDWRFLCDGSEPDFGPHTFLMKIIQLAGYGEDDARRIARDHLVQDLDRRIYGSAQANT